MKLSKMMAAIKQNISVQVIDVHSQKLSDNISLCDNYMLTGGHQHKIT